MVRRFIDRAALATGHERDAYTRNDRMGWTRHGDTRLAWHAAAVEVAVDVINTESPTDIEDAELRGRVWALTGDEIQATADRWASLPERTEATPLT